MSQKKEKPVPPRETALARFRLPSTLLLGAALLAALAVYSVSVTERWFYDDSDYVLNDPRLEKLSLFSPLHWHEPPPPIPKDADPDLYLPGYDKPLIADRYLWRLSFALERAFFGESYSAVHAHTINLLIHLACVAMLFVALTALLRLYTEEKSQETPRTAPWHLWPGIAALIFAVHPWAAEPVCYVSARNGSMGAFFSLGGLALWAAALRTDARLPRRIFCAAGMLLCCLAAYACKENFIVAPAVILLATWPLLWTRLRAWSSGGAVAVVVAMFALLLLIGYAGVRGSDRAAGLWAQTAHGHGRAYFMEIQNPILLMTLFDQLACWRLSLETGHPGWPATLCWLALGLNAALLGVGFFAGNRWPVLLALAAFYVLLLPTNSILPRPDFLAARNVYLPCAALAALFAGALIHLAGKNRRAALLAGGVLLAYWAVSAQVWAAGFAAPLKVWARSSKIAPEHATVRLNHGFAILKQSPNLDTQSRQAAEAELKAALAAEDSPTMRYHSARPRANRRALAWRALADLRRREERMPEAAELIQKSWQESNNLQTWLMWVDLCYDPKLSGQARVALDEGFRVWPDAWWTRVIRGLFRGRNMQTDAMTHEVYADLLAAEQAADAQIDPLRALQVRVLGILARAPQARERAPALLARMSNLGVPENELEELARVIGIGE